MSLVDGVEIEPRYGPDLREQRPNWQKTTEVRDADSGQASLKGAGRGRG